MHKEVKKIVISAMGIAIGVVFAQILHLIGGQSLGGMFSPMHIPVFIIGMLLGPKYGFLVGLLTPLASTLTRGMPVLFPTGMGMCLELATYGVVSGFFQNNLKLIKHQYLNSLVSLIIGMIAGRVIYGLYYSIYFLNIDSLYTFNLYLTAVIIKPFLGIILQVVIVPLGVYSGEKSNIIETLK